MGAATEKKRSRLADYTVYLALRIVFCVLQSLSPETCARLANSGAVLLHDVFRVRRDVLETNLRNAFPEMSARERDAIARAMFAHLLLMVCEIALAPRKIHKTNWRDHIRVVGCRELVQAFVDSRAIVAVTAHHGNFEMNGYVGGLLGFPSYTLARTLDNPYLHAFLARFRGATGQFILPTTQSAELAQRVIESGETLAALGDHYGGPKGAWVSFFDQPASCHKSIALFSLANKAPLMVVYTKRLAGSLCFQTELVDMIDPANDKHAPTSMADITQWYTSKIEAFIREAPEQYWWLHRRWKDTRAQHRAKRRRRQDAASDPIRPAAETGAAART